MVIEHEDTLLLLHNRLSTPIALLISEYAQELTRRQAVIFSIHANADEFREVNRSDWISLCHEVTI